MYFTCVLVDGALVQPLRVGVSNQYCPLKPSLTRSPAIVNTPSLFVVIGTGQAVPGVAHAACAPHGRAVSETLDSLSNGGEPSPVGSVLASTSTRWPSTVPEIDPSFVSFTVQVTVAPALTNNVGGVVAGAG